MKKIRVLVVDDSVAVRRLLSRWLNEDPAIEVVGAAENGRVALKMAAELKPDVVTLDVEMPEMDGLTTLKELRRANPTARVVMVSNLTAKGAQATITALSLGASDYVAKPSAIKSATAGLDSLRQELAPKLKALFPAYRPAGARPVSSPIAVRPAARIERKGPRARVDIVAIGVSTGGPNALAEVFAMLSEQMPVPIVVVQHMPPLFTRYLAERLDARSHINVREATVGQTVCGGDAWIAPGDFHLSLARHGTDVRTVLHQSPPENSCRPAVDVLFRSVAEVYGANVLGVVLTGMGQDGLRGCEAIRAAGGRVIVQDESSSVVWGMPGAVSRAGLADEVLPLDRIAQSIAQTVGAPLATLCEAGTR